MRDYRLKGIVLCGLVLTSALLSTSVGQVAQAMRRDIEPGIVAVVKNGRELGLEVSPPSGAEAQRFLQKHLVFEKEWHAYKDRGRVFIPIDRLKPDTQRAVLLAIYTRDISGPDGWTHIVLDERETLWSLCAWLTATGQNYREVMAHPKNRLSAPALRKGQKIFLPRHLLKPMMRLDNVPPAAPVHVNNTVAIAVEGLETSAVTNAVANPRTFEGLRYVQDNDGDYAAYVLKKGEALYTAVVVRYTDYQDNQAIKKASLAIANRSRINNIHDIDAGTEVRIPLAMLSDRYQPEGSSARKHLQSISDETVRLQKDPARSRDLSDVVVILDPGHGGYDHGASYPSLGLYEDEINYDIVCRIRKILLEETGARVYLTMIDKSSGLTPVELTRFSKDRDEELTTDPPYDNKHAKVSVNLRWMLVNSIYEKEIERGTEPRKVVFTSIHTDSLFNNSLRGAMIYYPDARLRRSEEVRRESVYARYYEGRQNNRFSATMQERLFDEAASKSFADILFAELGKNDIKRHDKGNAIRSKIRKGRHEVWVPGVLRNNKVPTKILVETANLENAKDRKWLAAPWWRQKFARAYVDALKTHFDSGNYLKTAMAK